MTEPPSVCVVDSNILIDLYVGGLLPEISRLPFRLVTPDVVIAELKEPDGESILEYSLESRELSSDQVLEVNSLTFRYRQVSTNDLFALVLARALRATLLTGDQHLRQVAKREGVPTHGVLWVLDEMVRLGLIAPSRAAQSLEQMLARGSRLPWAECQRRLKQWRLHVII